MMIVDSYATGEEEKGIPLNDGDVSSHTYTGCIVPSIPIPMPDRIL